MYTTYPMCGAFSIVIIIVIIIAYSPSLFLYTNRNRIQSNRNWNRRGIHKIQYIHSKRDNTSDIHTHYMHGKGDTMIYLTHARAHIYSNIQYNMFFISISTVLSVLYGAVLCCAVLCCVVLCCMLYIVHAACVCVRTSKRVQSMNKRYMYNFMGIALYASLFGVVTTQWERSERGGTH